MLLGGCPRTEEETPALDFYPERNCTSKNLIVSSFSLLIKVKKRKGENQLIEPLKFNSNSKFKD